MTFLVALWGTLKLPAGRASEWEDTVVDSDQHHDWGEDFCAGVEATTAGDLARGWEDLDPPDFVQVDRSGGELRFRGVLSEDAFRDVGQEVAAAFRAAESLGGRGELHFQGTGVDIAYRLRVTPGRSKLEAVDSDETAEEIEALMAEAQSRPKRRVVKKGAKKRAAKKSGKKR